MTHLLLYCDGSVRRGSRGGIGICIADGETGMPLKRFGEPLDTPQSSNEAEYRALLRGLEEALLLGAESIECYCDSSLVVEQVHGRFACNAPHLQQLRAQALELLGRFSSWTLERIPSERNQLAHTYATIASTQNRRKFFWQRPRKGNEHKTPTHEEVRNDMKLVVTAQAQVLPDDVYLVELVDVQQQTGAYGEQFVWQLRVAEGDYAGTELRAWSNASTAVNSKAIKWASAFNGKPYAQGDVIDLDALKGKVARAVVQVKQTADGREFARVTDILPLKRVTANQPQKPAVRVKDGMVAVPVSKAGFPDDDPSDPFLED